MRMRSRFIALLGLALLAVAPSAKAINVLQFTQQAVTTNKFSVIDDGAAPGSKIVTTNATGTEVFSIPILIGILDDGDVAISAWLRLENTGGSGLVSTTAATDDGTNITQVYTGTIRINSAADMSGTNYLTAVIGLSGKLKAVKGDTAAGYQAAEPGDSVIFSSDVVPIAHLGSPRSVSLSFTGLVPAAGLTGTRFTPFRSNGAGTFSAYVPEPSTVILGFMGAAPLALALRRKAKTVAS